MISLMCMPSALSLWPSGLSIHIYHGNITITIVSPPSGILTVLYLFTNLVTNYCGLVTTVRSTYNFPSICHYLLLHYNVPEAKVVCCSNKQQESKIEVAPIKLTVTVSPYYYS